ncbi:MAG: hypothetical protein RLY14_1893 [Planctomycetota bacterium]
MGTSLSTRATVCLPPPTPLPSSHSPKLSYDVLTVLSWMKSVAADTLHRQQAHRVFRLCHDAGGVFDTLSSRDGGRTRTTLNGSQDFKSCASAYSATRPLRIRMIAVPLKFAVMQSRITLANQRFKKRSLGD